MELYLTVEKVVFGEPIGQRPLLLLGALLIIVGVQLLSLGLIGELIANSRAREGPDTAQVACVVEACPPASLSAAAQTVAVGVTTAPSRTPVVPVSAASAEAGDAAASAAPGAADTP